MFDEHPFDLSAIETHSLRRIEVARCAEIKNILETNQDVQYISLRVVLSVYRPIIGIRTDPVTCNVFLYQSHQYI
jgi:hypothetical protein